MGEFRSQDDEKLVLDSWKASSFVRNFLLNTHDSNIRIFIYGPPCMCYINEFTEIDDKIFSSRIPSRKSIILKIKTDACKGQSTEVRYLEHVQAVATINSTRRGDLELFLTSPMGTRYLFELSHKNLLLILNFFKINDFE